MSALQSTTTGTSRVHALRRNSTQSSQSDITPPRFDWKTRVLLPVGLLLALAVMGAWSARDHVLGQTDVRVVPVMLKPVDAGSTAAGTVVVQAAGWVEPDPFAMNVSGLTDGIVEEVLVLEGQQVQKGQVLARLIDDDAKLALQRARAAEKTAEAELATARSDLAAARSHWENPVERRRAVDTTAARLAEARAELSRLPARITAAEARASELEENHQRVARALPKGASTEWEVNRMKHQWEAQRQAVQALAGLEPVLRAKIDELQADLAAARRNHELRIEERQALDRARARVDRAEAELLHARAIRAEAELRLERMQIRSPFDGTVMRRLKSPGDKLMAGMDDPRSTHVVNLYHPDELQVRVDVPLADAGRVRLGQPAEIYVDVQPDRPYAGQVTRVVHEADIQKNTLEVKVAIEDPSESIKPEMLARVKLLAKPEPSLTTDKQTEATRMLLVPRRLVQGQNDGTPWVLVARQNTARRVEIALGRMQSGDWLEVESGLSPGDRLIATDPETLSDGDRIRILGETTIE